MSCLFLFVLDLCIFFVLLLWGFRVGRLPIYIYNRKRINCETGRGETNELGYLILQCKLSPTPELQLKCVNGIEYIDRDEIRVLRKEKLYLKAGGHY